MSTEPENGWIVTTLGHPSLRSFALAAVASLAAVLAHGGLGAELDPEGLRRACVEDGSIEWLSAICSSALSSFGFFVVAWRSRFLRERPERWIRAMTLAWAVLMFMFFGEEISWGQRLLGIETPGWMSTINRQKETNLHNIFWIEQPIGVSTARSRS